MKCFSCVLPVLMLLVACNPTTKSTPHATSTPMLSPSPTIPPFTQMAQLDEHTGAVNSLQWSADGNRLASGGGDGRIIIWDIKLNTDLLKVKTSNAIWGVAWAPDGKKIAATGNGGAIIMDAKNGGIIADLPGPIDQTYSVAWSPDGKMIAVGYATGQVFIFDSQTTQVLQEWAGHIEGGLSTEVIAMAWSPDGKHLASGGLDYAVRFWDPTDGLAGVVLRADTQKRNDINGIAWSPDGRLLAAAGQDGTARIWDVKSRQLVMELGKASSAWVRGVAWSPNGKWLAISGADKLVHIWDAVSGENIATLTGHTSPVWSLAWSPDGKIIASGSGIYERSGGDTSIRLWRVP